MYVYITINKFNLESILLKLLILVCKQIVF